MTTFYRLKEDGKILDYIEFDLTTETKTEVVTEIEYKEEIVQEKFYDGDGNIVLQDVVKTIEVPYEVEETVTIDHVPAFIREQYIETERKIIKLTDGSFAFEDEVNLEEEAKRKAEKEFADAKNSKTTSMKAERDRIQELPIEYKGKFFDYNKESLQKLNEAKDDLEGTEDKQIWICADNSLTYLTYNDIMAIKKLGKERSNDVHIQYAKLKYLIEMAKTVEEVEAITFETDTSDIPLEV